MFDFVHEKKRLVQIVLLLIILPFAFWGVDSYQKSGGAEFLAKVNGEKVSQQEFDNVLQQQQGRMKEMMGAAFDPAMFDKPEIKLSILENLVNQKLLSAQAKAAGLTISDEQLARVIAGIEAFQKDGKFDKQRYESLLSMQQMTPLIFEGRVKQELLLRQLTDAYSQGGYATKSIADDLIRLTEQQRNVSIAPVSASSYLAQTKVSEVEIKAYYDKNQQEFQIPEQVRVESVVLSVDALLSQVDVSDADLKKFYEEHQADFGAPEQRQAAHILISASAQAPAAEQGAAKAKAQQILDQIKKQPAKFAELAKQYSQDPGSAANGGDLGYFGRGAMVKPFEDAAFALSAGGVSELVQSDFGFHIIKVLAIKPSRTVAFDEVKAVIAQKLKQQKANDKFAELAEKFSNAVYEQSDTLKPAAELGKLPLQQSAWLSKGQPAIEPWTDKVLQAVFSEDVVKNKRNTAAIEIAPNTLFSARMLEHKPASARPLSEVTPQIRQKLSNQQAQALAVKQGKEWLEQSRRGEGVAANWGAPRLVSRAQHTGLDGDLMQQVFQAESTKLPVYVGAESGQGFILVRVEAIKNIAAIDDAKRARYIQQLRQITGEELLGAYLDDSRKHADISIRQFAEAEKK
ncbi:MAG: SurA N-terminal domain-containing protein [Nitrosomonadales bacterium]|nr:SurA N-terminal domain-containing protein [Nitrosomonadales bacterium]